MKLELVNITAITETIEKVRDRQRAAYEELSPKKTIARHIASTHVEFCEQLLQAIVKMEKTEITPPQWIPVTERLPENSAPVLVYDKWRTIPGGNVDMMSYYPQAQRWEIDRDVTHWMPLPAKPEGIK